MATKLLNKEVTEQVREVFNQLREPVQVFLFTKTSDCDYCDDTRQLVEEVVSISDKISFDVYDIEKDEALARQYKVDKAPEIVIAGRDGDHVLDYGIRFAGIPSGHEFSSLIHDLVLVSGRDSGLDPKTREFLKGLDKPVHLQVFVTPSCPYCPRAVVLAHQMAMESPMIEAEGIEATEFPDLAGQFNVSGVPQTTINAGAGTLVGAAPAEHLVAEIKKAMANHGN